MVPPHSPAIICLKNYPHNLSFPTLWWIGNNLEVQPRFMLKNKPFSIFFSWIGKNWEVQPEQHLKISKSCCESEKNIFSMEKMKFWTHHELERPGIKILIIWCITQVGNLSNESTYTASLHSKQWFHEVVWINLCKF